MDRLCLPIYRIRTNWSDISKMFNDPSFKNNAESFHQVHKRHLLCALACLCMWMIRIPQKRLSCWYVCADKHSDRSRAIGAAEEMHWSARRAKGMLCVCGHMHRGRRWSSGWWEQSRCKHMQEDVLADGSHLRGGGVHHRICLSGTAGDLNGRTTLWKGKCCWDGWLINIIHGSRWNEAFYCLHCCMRKHEHLRGIWMHERRDCFILMSYHLSMNILWW